MEETSNARLLGGLKLINQKLVLNMLNQFMKYIYLIWGMKRILMAIRRALLEQCSSLRTISIENQRMHEERYGYLLLYSTYTNPDILISFRKASYL